MVSRKDGAPINELDHIFQSVEMILTTPIGTRVMRRDFGSLVPLLVDGPINASTITAIYAAANEAIATWEPRVRVIGTSMDVSKATEGIAELKVVLQIAGEETAVDVTIPNAP